MAKALIIHEDEAGVLLDAVLCRLRAPGWNLTEDEDECTVTFLFALRRKLEDYMDGKSEKDVVEVP